MTPQAEGTEEVQPGKGVRHDDDDDGDEEDEDTADAETEVVAFPLPAQGEAHPLLC